MNDLIIIGSGGHARSVIDTVTLNDKFNICGVLDINFEASSNEKILGFSVLGGLELLKSFSPKTTVIFLAVGDNETRKKISLLTEYNRFETTNIVHPQAYVSENALLGAGNFIGAFANIGAGAEIGNHCLMNTFSNLEHDVKVGDFCQFSPGSIVCGRSVISDNVFVGAGGIILDKISVSNGVIVGAGAVVTKNITDLNSTFVGVPARKH